MSKRVTVKLKATIGEGSAVVIAAGIIIEVTRKRADELVAQGLAEIVKGKIDKPEAAAVKPDEAAVQPRAKLRKKFG